ncbi:general amino acid permease [Fusarium napiforme]|uniref:General amino acid permease n=1 Tax=Fusarium napiforme TaxID=42672 RepID=A0A8H5NBM7_9HYPO|nr:general amino acid permease [Fusarium napiforme]
MTASLEKADGDENISTPVADHAVVPIQQTRRGLSPRHVQLMTIAGGFGVGLFVGVGGVLSKAGPLPLIIGYLIYGLGFIWPTMLNVAEMVAWLPIRGSIYELASRFVDAALGFAMGWIYFYAGAMLVCTEYSAVATVMQYWNTDINPAVWIAIALSFCYFMNMVAVRWYGEAEFIMGSTRILLILGLIMATFVTIVGGNPHHDAYGFRNWKNGDMAHEYYAEGATGIFLSICICVRYAVFTIGGPDIISLSASEIRNPRKTIPKVAKLIVGRILFFYVVGSLLLASSATRVTLDFWVRLRTAKLAQQRLPGFWVFSVSISEGFFLDSSTFSSCCLDAQDGQAPKIFLRCTKSGVPWVCVTAVTAISLLSFLVASASASEVFSWFLDFTTVALVVKFTAMTWVFIGWCRALKAQGITRQGENNFKKSLFKKTSDRQPAPGIVFPYTAPCASWTPYLCLFIGGSTSIFIRFDIFQPWSLKGFITSYFGLAWFFFMFIFWKVFKRTKFVTPATVDIFADGKKQAVDEECRFWEEGFGDEAERDALAKKHVIIRTWARFWGG